jgi:hypothetical protein
MRLCSLLVKRGLLDFDQASRALGELHGSAAVLRRHLEGRDEGLVDMLPDEAAKQLVALPIGRLGNGALIVCVRDPSPALQAKLTRLLREEVVLAVAPAHYLERLVAAVYAPRELDADDLEEAVDQVSDELDIPVEIEEPAVDFSIDIEEVVTRPRPRRTSKPSKPPKKRALSVVIPTMAAPTGATRDALDATLSSFRQIDDLEWLFDVAMQYVSKHWNASLLLALKETRAVGVRGHGARITPSTVKTFVVDIAEVTLLQRARDERRIIADALLTEPGAEHEVVDRALGARGTPTAAPLVRGDAVTHVLLLGEPTVKDRDDALVDLGLLVESMSDALARI